MSEAKMSEDKISEAKIDIKIETKISEPKISEPKIRESKIRESKIRESKIRESKIRESKISKTKISDAKMIEAKINEAKMSDEEFEESGINKRMDRIISNLARSQIALSDIEEFLEQSSLGHEEIEEDGEDEEEQKASAFESSKSESEMITEASIHESSLSLEFQERKIEKLDKDEIEGSEEGDEEEYEDGDEEEVDEEEEREAMMEEYEEDEEYKPAITVTSKPDESKIDVDEGKLIPHRTLYDFKRFTAQDIFSADVSMASSVESSSLKVGWKNLDLSNIQDYELVAGLMTFKEESNILDVETTMLVNHIQRLIHIGYTLKSKSELKLNVKIPSLFRKMTGLKGLTPFVPSTLKSLNMRHKIDIVKIELSVLKDAVKREANKVKRAIKIASSGIIDLTRQLNTLRDKRAAFDENFDSSTVALAGVGKPKNTDILRFWQDEVHKMESDVLKLRLKKVALRLNLAKLQSMTNQAEETNETLSENDIHLMKIKNHILNKKIKEGNENLLVLKITAGKMRLKLNGLRTSLIEAEKISSIVDTKILMANDQAEKSTQEIKHVNKGLGKIKEQNKNILRYINTYSVPEVIEYAKFVENVQPLERQIKHYVRKIDVKMNEIKKAEKVLNDRVRNKQVTTDGKCNPQQTTED